MQRPDPEYLVDGLLVEGTLSMMAGRHSSYKSFIALEIALCVATGRNAFGLKTKHGSVAYIAAEGERGFKKRTDAWCKHYDTPVPQNFDVFGAALQITDQELLEVFLDHIGQKDLIILDTLARCADGLEENNAKDMGNFIHAATQISKTANAHVLIVHHNNKNDDSYRGSSALAAGVDTIIAVSKENNAVTLSVKKQKDDDERDDIKLIALQSHNSLILRPNQNLSPNEQAILAELAKQPATYTQTLQKTALPESTFERAWGQLKNKKLIEIELKTDGKTSKIYRLPPTPNPIP